MRRGTEDSVVVEIDEFGGETKAYAGVPAEPKLPANAPRSIAEMFQDMLWQAFCAGMQCHDGLGREATRLAFEAWYESEVLK